MRTPYHILLGDGYIHAESVNITAAGFPELALVDNIRIKGTAGCEKSQKDWASIVEHSNAAIMFGIVPLTETSLHALRQAPRILLETNTSLASVKKSAQKANMAG